MKSNLSTLMGKHRYSIQEVHAKTGLARGTIAQLYHDRATRVDFDTIEKLCCLFKCDVSQLFVLDSNQNIVENKNNGE